MSLSNMKCQAPLRCDYKSLPFIRESGSEIVSDRENDDDYTIRTVQKKELCGFDFLEEEQCAFLETIRKQNTTF